MKILKILIDNIAKINKAEIIVDGITVIAGKNSTGKTTIGKSFFAIFNSLFDSDNKLKNARENYIFKYIFNTIRKYFPDLDETETIKNDFSTWEFARTINNSIFKSSPNNDLMKILFETVENYCNKVNISIGIDTISSFCKNILEGVNKTNNIENKQLLKEIVDRYFNPVFNGQINNLTNDNVSKITLLIKNKEISATFQNNQCIDIDNSINILHEAFYIDNPFVLDELSNYNYMPRRTRNSQIQKRLLIKALTEKKEDILDDLVDAVSAKEKLTKIYEILDETIPGSFSEGEKGLNVVVPGFKVPITVANLSTGMKSFALIKLLLEKGALKEKDILILDEPEIHLHPEWLLRYAEIIVLLQKHFNLSLIITTHSSNFLEAIEYYSNYYSISENCKYYLSCIKDQMCVFEDVTDNIEKIYAEMIEPSILIDRLKYKMEDLNNE